MYPPMKLLKPLVATASTTILLISLSACSAPETPVVPAPVVNQAPTPDTPVPAEPSEAAEAEPTPSVSTPDSSSFPEANPENLTDTNQPKAEEPSDGIATGITVQRDIPYTSNARVGDTTTTLTLDLYSPANEAGEPLLSNRPAVLLMHGGAFLVGSKNLPNMERWANALVEEGYVVANINYRLLLANPTVSTPEIIEYLNNADPTSALPAQAPPESIDALRIGLGAALEDSNAALTWLTEQGVNPDKIAVAGESAGAITALHLAYLNDTLNLNPVTPAAIVNLYGAMSKPSAGGTEITSSTEPPLWTLHGSTDVVVPYKAAEYLDEQTSNADIPHVLHRVNNVGHGFESVGFFTRTLDDSDTTYLQDSINFLNEHLK